MAKQYLFVSNRDITIASIYGHAIAFTKGVPVHVPRVMHAEVMEKGCVPADGDGKTLSADQLEDPAMPAPKVLLAPDDAGERADAIKVVLEEIGKRNSPADFTAGGVPSSSSVTAALGWKVDPKEIRPLWLAYKQARAEEGK